MTEEKTARTAPDIEKFLSLGITAGLNRKVHTHAALLDRFPPDAIMGFLADEPAKRGRVLTTVLHIPPKTARSLSAADAGRLLQAGYDAEEAAPEKIIESLTPDDIARHFPRVALWAFITHNEWWKKRAVAGQDTAPREFMTALLETALTHRLLTPREILMGLGADTLARALPEPLLEKVCEEAVRSGLDGQPLKPEHVLQIVSIRQLVDFLELECPYSRLIVPLAAKHGLVLDESAERNGPPTQGATPRARSTPPLASGGAPPAGQTPKAAATAPKGTTQRPPTRETKAVGTQAPLAHDTTRDAAAAGADEEWENPFDDLTRPRPI